MGIRILDFIIKESILLEPPDYTGPYGQCFIYGGGGKGEIPPPLDLS
jgi:hypothetical protein